MLKQNPQKPKNSPISLLKQKPEIILTLTSFLHEDKEFVEKLLPLWVIIQFIELGICRVILVTNSSVFFLNEFLSTISDLGKVPGWLSSHFASVVLLGPDAAAASLETRQHQ